MRRLVALALPWILALFLVAVYARTGWPLVTSSHLLGIVAGLFLTTVLLSFILAAATVTRDLLSGSPLRPKR